MIPPSFDYHAPSTVAEAVGLLAQLGDDAKILAGGHSLLPMMKLRFAEPGALIDLNRIDALRGVSEEGGKIRIGAMTTENQLIASDLLKTRVPLLPEAARQIADPQVRNRGTIGGDIAHGDPANDHPAIAMALDATFVITGPNGERQVPATEFFLGTYYTAIEADEILTAILVQPFAPKTGYAYTKLKRKTGDWATAAAAVVMTMDGDRVASVRIGLTNVAPTALRASDAEQSLVGKTLDAATLDEVARLVRGVAEPAADLRGDEEYKTAMAGEMTKRALRQAAERCR
ncbi:FAD binding domain-containing protein [Azoarcus taiwanensis]|uniref:Xanthine dehydrogenase family protein subunit M n=1 Tax=Azoarcus taiwanensis TaxID=666964 RepID=A0A972FMF0_9RHOO|nr:xanthine dehydrogenase family protein subunit M [Azoarcus taiwanensis]NMG04936.1 xanthine dehydrogenase family protein subunit M [Azoarcus taiwanensis]